MTKLTQSPLPDDTQLNRALESGPAELALEPHAHHPLNALSQITPKILIRLTNSDTRLSTACKTFDWAKTGWNITFTLHSLAPKHFYQTLLALDNLHQALKQMHWPLSQAHNLIDAILPCIQNNPATTLSASLVLCMTLNDLNLSVDEIQNFIGSCAIDNSAAKDGWLFKKCEQFLSNYSLKTDDQSASEIARRLTDDKRLAPLSNVISCLYTLCESNQTDRLLKAISNFTKSDDIWTPIVILNSASTAEEDIINKAFVRKLVRNFSRTFHADDKCTLRIGADKTEDIDWLHSLELYSDQARIELIPQPLMGERDSLLGWSLKVQNQLLSAPEHIFNEYSKHLELTHNAFELSSVNNVYDLDYIREKRVSSPGYLGSTSLTSFAYLEAAQKAGGHYANILDVGCGGGALYGLIKANCEMQKTKMPVYAGLDTSRAQIARAKNSFPHGHFIIADAINIPFEAKAFDLVVANSVMCFIPDDKQKLALEEMLRVSRGEIFVALTCTSDKPFAVPSELNGKAFGDVRIKIFHPKLTDILSFLERQPQLAHICLSHYYLYVPTKEKWLEIEESQFNKLLDEYKNLTSRIDPQTKIVYPTVNGEQAIPYQTEDVIILPKAWTQLGDIQTMSVELEAAFKRLFGN